LPIAQRRLLIALEQLPIADMREAFAVEVKGCAVCLRR
jgi:hypothetical protein